MNSLNEEDPTSNNSGLPPIVSVTNSETWEKK